MLAVAASMVLLTVLLVLPVRGAADDIELILDPVECELGDEIDVEAQGLEPGEYYNLYLSGDRAVSGDIIGDDVDLYKLLERNVEAAGEESHFPGEFHTSFNVPEELADGEEVEDVHGGEYYFCVAERIEKTIIAVAVLTVAYGEIEAEPEAGTVGSEVVIHGEGLRPEQRISLAYDGKGIDISGGDTTTDADGQFTCRIAVPEYPSGTYVITARDESGNRPETEFSVEPQIAVSPLVQDVDKAVEVSGDGFGARESLTVFLDGVDMVTQPVSLHTTRLGSLSGKFVVPPLPAYTDGAVALVRVRDESDNVAETELTIRPIAASISLNPATDPLSPGHVGMELTVSGIWFTPEAAITIIYDDAGEPLNVATTEAHENRNFSVAFNVPPSQPGSHTVTASDGENSVAADFILEAVPPVTPLPQSPALAATVGPAVSFDWGDVTDPSGITYVLQIGADSDFSSLVLEKRGLTASEYTLSADERAGMVAGEVAYYWRVRAVDGTASESDWTIPSSFYVSEAPVVPGNGSMKYIWIGVGGAVAAVIIALVRRRAE